MNKSITSIVLLLLLSIAYKQPLSAQISEGGEPVSFSKTFQDLYSGRRAATQNLPALDMKKVQAADRANVGTVRFAAPVDVAIGLTDGEWVELPSGDRIWQIRFSAADALGLFIAYDDFYLPFGSRLHMYSDDRQQLLGAYTSRNNRSSGNFFTGMIRGTSAILELYEPASVKGQSRIHVYRIYQAYEPTHIEPSDYPFQVRMAGFGDALSCHININCPEGDPWQDHKRGVVRMLRVFEEGVGWCSGTLINNTNEDGTPYVLSAFHCIAGFTPLLDFWRFDFMYEGADCNDPTEEPADQSILGCTHVAGREESDFLLLEMSKRVPSSFQPYFVGWDRSSTALPDSTIAIHHPEGDIRKISLDYDPATIYPQSIIWNNNVTTPANHHFRVEFDDGTFENGSSGSALFNEDGRIAGQLHGGLSNCSRFVGFYGRFSISWDAGATPDARLMDWLDPAGSGAMQLGAYEPPPEASISGAVRTSSGQPIAHTTVYLNGSWQDSVLTDASGIFSFSVPRGGSYTLSAKKSSAPTNGVSAFDIVLIQKHILGFTPFTDPIHLLAADVNNSGSITSFDLVIIRKVLLFFNDNFPNDDSWRFVEDILDVPDVNDDVSGLQFTGYKVGDVNDNANPGL